MSRFLATILLLAAWFLSLVCVYQDGVIRQQSIVIQTLMTPSTPPSDLMGPPPEAAPDTAPNAEHPGSYDPFNRRPFNSRI